MVYFKVDKGNKQFYGKTYRCIVYLPMPSLDDFEESKLKKKMSLVGMSSTSLLRKQLYKCILLTIDSWSG